MFTCAPSAKQAWAGCSGLTALTQWPLCPGNASSHLFHTHSLHGQPVECGCAPFHSLSMGFSNLTYEPPILFVIKKKTTLLANHWYQFRPHTSCLPAFPFSCWCFLVAHHSGWVPSARGPAPNELLLVCWVLVTLIRLWSRNETFWINFINIDNKILEHYGCYIHQSSKICSLKRMWEVLPLSVLPKTYKASISCWAIYRIPWAAS